MHEKADSNRIKTSSAKTVRNQLIIWWQGLYIFCLSYFSTMPRYYVHELLFKFSIAGIIYQLMSIEGSDTAMFTIFDQEAEKTILASRTQWSWGSSMRTECNKEKTKWTCSLLCRCRLTCQFLFLWIFQQNNSIAFFPLLLDSQNRWAMIFTWLRIFGGV